MALPETTGIHIIRVGSMPSTPQPLTLYYDESDANTPFKIVGTNGTVYAWPSSVLATGDNPQQVSSGEITAGTETALRSYSVADLVAIVAAHETGEANPAQASAGEITAGTETGLRLYSLADLKTFVDTHGGGGGGLSAGYASGSYYGPYGAIYVPSLPSDSPSTEIHYLPFTVTEEQEWDRLSVNVDTAGTGAGRIILGIYDSANGMPNDRLVTSGELDASSTGLLEHTMSLTLSAGVYWTAIVANEGGIAVEGLQYNAIANTEFIKQSAPNNNLNNHYTLSIGTFGNGLPANAVSGGPVNANPGNVPLVRRRAA